jgi:hypothetical protein
VMTVSPGLSSARPDRGAGAGELNRPTTEFPHPIDKGPDHLAETRSRPIACDMCARCPQRRHGLQDVEMLVCTWPAQALVRLRPTGT